MAGYNCDIPKFVGRIQNYSWFLNLPKHRPSSAQMLRCWYFNSNPIKPSFLINTWMGPIIWNEITQFHMYSLKYQVNRTCSMNTHRRQNPENHLPRYWTLPPESAKATQILGEVNWERDGWVTNTGSWSIHVNIWRLYHFFSGKLCTFDFSPRIHAQIR